MDRVGWKVQGYTYCQQLTNKGLVDRLKANSLTFKADLNDNNMLTTPLIFWKSRTQLCNFWITEPIFTTTSLSEK